MWETIKSLIKIGTVLIPVLTEVKTMDCISTNKVKKSSRKQNIANKCSGKDN